ncbi:hypothetical protein T10_6928 [Trichinella papuae]|uniref:Uncharacterized protein n=1 Tax=Trichinella papuae TaxID=268474 RepID=A0A0V1N220_9BILA|nr:hypothetical protein T10_6928 [Trichinella papuae]
MKIYIVFKIQNNYVNATKICHTISQINLTALMSHWLKLFCNWSFLSDEFCQIHVVYKFEFATIKLCNCFFCQGNYIVIRNIAVHIDEIAYLLFIEVKLTNLWTIYWRNESMNVLCCIVKESNFEEF